MDELSIFIHPDKLSSEDPSALQLLGSADDTPVVDVVLSALSDGTRLTPILFFRGTTLPVPDGFPDNVLLEARQEGFTNEERLQIWIDKVGADEQLNHSLLLRLSGNIWISALLF